MGSTFFTDLPIFSRREVPMVASLAAAPRPMEHLLNNDDEEDSRNGAVVYPAESAPYLSTIYEETPIQEQANPKNSRSRILIVDDSSINR